MKIVSVVNGTPVPMEERSQWVSSTPVGFRDLYWCPSLNEPFVGLECGYCKINMAEDGNHVFLGHVRKPY